MQEFEYMLLNRLQTDCDYYLAHGCGLWGINPKDHIDKMHELWNILEIKPEWLTKAELEDLSDKVLNHAFN